MNATPKKRGGSHTARERNDRGNVDHDSPVAYAAFDAAAAAAGLTLKDHCRRILLAAHGMEDDREVAPRRNKP